MDLPKRAETYIAKCQFCDWMSHQARAETAYFAKKHMADLARAVLDHVKQAHPEKIAEIDALHKAIPPPPLHQHTRKRSVKKLREDHELYTKALTRIIED